MAGVVLAWVVDTLISHRVAGIFTGIRGHKTLFTNLTYVKGIGNHGVQTMRKNKLVSGSFSCPYLPGQYRKIP